MQPYAVVAGEPFTSHLQIQVLRGVVHAVNGETQRSTRRCDFYRPQLSSTIPRPDTALEAHAPITQTEGWQSIRKLHTATIDPLTDWVNDGSITSSIHSYPRDVNVSVASPDTGAAAASTSSGVRCASAINSTCETHTPCGARSTSMHCGSCASLERHAHDNIERSRRRLARSDTVERLG